MKPSFSFLARLLIFPLLVLLVACGESKLYEEAEQLYKQEQFAEAKTKYYTFLQQYPDSEKAGIAQTRLEVLDDLIHVKELQKQAELALHMDDPKNAYEKFERALVLGLKGDYSETEALRTSLEEAKSAYLKKLEAEGDVHQEAKRWDDALKAYRTALDLTPSERSAPLKAKITQVQQTLDQKASEKMLASYSAEAELLRLQRMAAEKKVEGYEKMSEKQLVEILFPTRATQKDSGPEVLRGGQAQSSSETPQGTKEMEKMMKQMGMPKGGGMPAMPNLPGGRKMPTPRQE